VKRKRTITEKLSPILAGMETETLARVQAEAEARAAEMSAKLLEPMGNVNGKAGKMEREFPLFLGTGQNPCLW